MLPVVSFFLLGDLCVRLFRYGLMPEVKIGWLIYWLTKAVERLTFNRAINLFSALTLLVGWWEGRPVCKKNLAPAITRPNLELSPRTMGRLKKLKVTVVVLAAANTAYSG